METTVSQIEEFFQRHKRVLTGCDAQLAGRDVILVVSRELIPSRLDLPRSLQTFNTQVVEILNADWGNPTTLASIGPHLENLCEFWENIHQAHAAAMNIFEAAQTRSAPYCLYLRSFSRVSDVEVAVPQGRAVGYVNDQRLDRNIARALADRASILNPVTCLHTDDLGLLAGEWILPSFRVHDHDWQRPLIEAIRASKLIVIYVAGQSGGVEFELGQIERAGMIPRTVLVFDTHDVAKGVTDIAGACAGAMPVTGFIEQSPDNIDDVHLSAEAHLLLTKLAADSYQPPPPATELARLRGDVVDPKVPPGLPADVDLERSFFVTDSNVTAFSWYVRGLPEVLERWNRIARVMYQEKRGPDREDVQAQQRNLVMASVGAAALGLTASLAALIGFRVIFANVFQVQDPVVRARRKKQLLALLDVANRFDDLTKRRQWREQNEKWREVIVEDAFS